MLQNVLYRGATSLHGLGVGVSLGQPAHSPSTMLPVWAFASGVGGAAGGPWRAGGAMTKRARWGGVGRLWRAT